MIGSINNILDLIYNKNKINQMALKKFNKFKINESEEFMEAPVETGSKASKLTGEVTLYRLTSHPVVDLSSPGEYYVCDKGDIDPNILDTKEGDELYLITVTCDSNNIDLDKSEMEVSNLGNDSIVAVKDDNSCKVISVTPYGK